MGNRKIYVICLFLVVFLNNHTALFSQDALYAKEVITKLASADMAGRGYVKDGSAKAAAYISQEMGKAGLLSFDSTYLQDFHVNVKTYPDNVKLAIDDKPLKPADDFTIVAGSPSVNQSYKIQVIDTLLVNNHNKWNKFLKKDLSRSLIALDPGAFKNSNKKLADSMLMTNFPGAAGYMYIVNKPGLTWSVMAPPEVLPYPIISVLAGSVTKKTKKADLEIALKAIDEYKVSNVIGYIPGTSKIDSFLVITAHYDHLGMLGNTAYFPGANDNASGVAMLLDMAGYFNKPENRLPYSVVFMAFAGEEIGLKGSEFAAANPLFPLSNIKFLINLDMVGTGSEGITMVNAIQHPKQYKKMTEINADNEYLLKVASRGESCNSDHCPFYKRGVPAIFIYSMGKEHQEYHNTKDTADRVPLTEYNDIFRLIRDFLVTF